MTVYDAKRALRFGAILCATLCSATIAQAQEADRAGGEAEASEEAEYRHAISVFGGAITRTERGDTGGAIGLSYGYGVLPKWAVGVKAEYASGSIERDWLLLFGVVFEPVDRVEFGVGIGPERVERTEIEEGEEGEEVVVEEIEALLRLTAGYVFRLGDRTALSPEFNVDIGSQVSLVYGLVFTVKL
jgi:hypothetical protein